MVLPANLRVLMRHDGEVHLDLPDASPETILDALEGRYPMLAGTIRDRVTKKRRAYVRYFACGRDISHDPTEVPLPEDVQNGRQPFMIVGAISGG